MIDCEKLQYDIDENSTLVGDVISQFNPGGVDAIDDSPLVHNAAHSQKSEEEWAATYIQTAFRGFLVLSSANCA